MQLKLNFMASYFVFTKKNQPFAASVGSSNLDSILNNHRKFEADIVLKDKKSIREIANFITQTLPNICDPINRVKNIKIVDRGAPLDGIDEVEKVSEKKIEEIRKNCFKAKFEIPLKVSSQHIKSI